MRIYDAQLSVCTRAAVPVQVASTPSSCYYWRMRCLEADRVRRLHVLGMLQLIEFISHGCNNW